MEVHSRRRIARAKPSWWPDGWDWPFEEPVDPEEPGDGETGGGGVDNGPKYKMVAFGDSMGQGASDYVLGEGFLGYNLRYARYLEEDTGTPVELTNLSHGGYRSDHILAAMRSPEGLAAIQQADVITWDGGGNNWREARLVYRDGFCGGPSDTRCLNEMGVAFSSHYESICQLITENKKPSALVLSMMYFYPYCAEDQSKNTYSGDAGNDFVVLSQYLRWMRDEARKKSATHGFKFLDLIPLFNGQYGVMDPTVYGYTRPSDKLHPTTAGHILIADKLREMGYAPLWAPPTEDPTSS